MLVYIIAIVIALTGAILYERMTPTLRNILLISLCVYIILIIGFRYKVGIDTLNYMKSFRYIPSIDHFFSVRTISSTRYEPGFLFICSLCKTFSNEFWPVQLIMAFITNSCIFIFLHRYCKNVFIGVLFYFFLACLYFSTEILRESAAIGIFLLNYKNLEDKRWLNYYLWSVLSILFHYSAIVILFFPFARWLKPNLLFIILCVVFLAITPLVENLNKLIQLASISGRISQYVDGAEDLNFNWRIGELIKSAFPAIATIILYHIYRKNLKFNYMLLLQVLFSMGAFAIPLIFSRFRNYTVLFVVVAATNLLSFKSIQQWIKILYVSFVLLTQSYYYYSNYKIWIPYSSIFYPQEYPERTKMYRHIFLPWLRFTK